MKKLLLLLLSILCLGASEMKATHMMGADVKYECLGNGRYKITLKVYRDCTGVNLGGISGTIRCGNNSTSFSPTKKGVRDITPTCAGSVSACKNQQSGLGIGVEEHTYEAIVDFTKAPYSTWKKNGCCEFRISWGQCCRNNEINTINNGSFYADAMVNLCNIDKTKKKCNDSPDLTSDPIAFLCCNNPYYFNNGALDNKDYDSLSYSLVAPQSSYGNNMTHKSPFSSKYPMTPKCIPPGRVDCRPVPNASPPLGFYLDPINGDLVFTPTKCDEVGIVVIEIKEWRKDSSGKYVHIGTTRRDMQLIVMNCGSNWPPSVTSGKYDYTVCEGDNIKISIDGKDHPHPSDPNGRKDTVALKWNFGIPQGKFKVLNPSAREKQAEFEWKTKIGDAQDAPYTFTVTAQDDACPLKATTIRGFSIKVLPRALGERTYNLLKCGAMEFSVEPNNGFALPADYKWEVYDSTDLTFPLYTSSFKKDTVQFTKGGTYYFKLQLDNRYNCMNITTDTVHIPPLLDVDLSFGPDTFVCRGSDLDIRPLIINGIKPLRYKWKTPVNHSPGDTLDNFTITPDTDTALALVIIDGNGCMDSTSMKIFIKELPLVDLGPDQVLCTYEDVTFDAGHDDTLSYLWTPTGDTTQTIKTNLAGDYMVMVEDTLGCIGRDTVNVIVNDTVVPDAGFDREICLYDTLPLYSEGKPNANFDSRGFVWKDLSDNSTVGTKDEERVSPATDRCYELYMTVKQNGHDCENEDTICVVVNPLPDLYTKPLRPYCYNYGRINLTSDLAPRTKDIIFRSDVAGLVVKEGSTYWFNTDDLPNKGQTIKVYKEYTDPITFCYALDSINVVIQPKPVVLLADATRCQDYGEVELSATKEKIVVLPNASNITGGFRTWTILSGPDGQTPPPTGALRNDGNGFNAKWIFNLGYGNASRLGKYEMEFKFENTTTGCIGYDTMELDVVVVPVVEFSPIPPQCVNWDTLDLDNYVNLTNGVWKVIEEGNKRANPAGQYDNYVIDEHNFDPSIGVNPFNKYLLRYDHTASGCPTKDSISLIVNNLPRIEPPVLDTVCNTLGSVALFAKVDGAPNKPGVIWSGTHVTGSQFIPTNVESDTAQDFSGPYTIKLYYTNPVSKCSDSSETIITVQAQPTINILEPTDNFGMCEGSTFILNAESTHDNGILWTSLGDGAITEATNLNTDYIHGPGDMIARGVDFKVETVPYGTACPAVEQEVSVVIHPKPTVSFDSPVSECAPYTANFYYGDDNDTMGITNLAFEWDLDDGQTAITRDALDIPYTKEGTFDVGLIVRNMAVADGSCFTELIQPGYVHIHPIPVANFLMSPDGYTTVALPEFKFKDTSTISSGTIVQRNWDFDLFDRLGFDASIRYSNELNPAISYGLDTVTACVMLEVVSDSGCMDSIVKCLKVGPDVTVFIPNAFTPNGAGPPEDNTFWVSVQGQIGFNLQIFNRWGELLFESDKAMEPAFGWDGTYHNGELVQQDAFMYVCTVIGFDGETYEYKGTVTLLR